MAQLNVHLKPQSPIFTYSGYLAHHVSDRGWLAYWLFTFSSYVKANSFALT